MSVNKVILLGNLATEPEFKELQSGNMCSFVVATNRGWTRDGDRHEDRQFIPVIGWGKQAELQKDILQKGREVYIEGHINVRSWVDEDGNKRFRTEVVTEFFKALGPRPDGKEDTVSTNDNNKAEDNVEIPDTIEGESDDVPVV